METTIKKDAVKTKNWKVLFSQSKLFLISHNGEYNVKKHVAQNETELK